MGEEPNGIQISAVSSHRVTKSMGLALRAALGLSLPLTEEGDKLSCLVSMTLGNNSKVLPPHPTPRLGRGKWGKVRAREQSTAQLLPTRVQ